MEINEIVSAIESLTLIQASELVKALEEKFGVSAAAPVAAAGVAGAPAAAAEERPSLTSFWLASTPLRRSPSSRPSARSCRAWA